MKVASIRNTARNALQFRVAHLFLLVLFVALILQSYGSREQLHREARSESRCRAHMSLISMALQDYRDVHGRFPPAFVADVNGRRLHSWRVLLLPHFRDNRLNEIYHEYDFNEPWDGEINQKLMGQCPDAYQCPSDSPSDGSTNYVVVTGSRMLFDSALSGSLALEEAHDTIAVVEVAGIYINWLEPRDLELESMDLRVGSPSGNNISSRHRAGPHIARADGTADKLLPSTTESDLLVLLDARASAEDKRRAGARCTLGAD